MDYFYAPPDKISRDRVNIEGEEFNHLVHVMRKKEGDEIRVVDGAGVTYDVTIVGMKRRTAVGRIGTRYRSLNEPSLDLHIAVGILRNPSRFDFLVEKITEIGVNRIVPMRTERTIPRHAKPGRWQKLAVAAMKQSGRSVLPLVEELRSLPEVLATVRRYDRAVVCHEGDEADTSLASVVENSGVKSMLLLVGPEGGFSREEITACVTGGCVVASLGPRRLRTETAAIVAAALVLQARRLLRFP